MIATGLAPLAWLFGISAGLVAFLLAIRAVDHWRQRKHERC